MLLRKRYLAKSNKSRLAKKRGKLGERTSTMRMKRLYPKKLNLVRKSEKKLHLLTYKNLKLHPKKYKNIRQSGYWTAF